MSDAQTLFDVVGEVQERAWALHAEGRLDDAHAACSEALAHLEHAGFGSAPDAANILADLADVERDRGRLSDALGHALRARTIVAPFVGVVSADDALEKASATAVESDLDSDGARLAIRVFTCVGALHRTLADYGRSASDFAVALRVAAAAFGEDSLEVAECRNEVAVVQKFAGRFDESERLYALVLPVIQREHGAESLEAAAVLHNIGGVLHARGEYARAEEPARRAWELSRSGLGDADPRVAADACAYAAVLFGLGKYEESEAHYRRSLAVVERIDGSGVLETAAVLHDLAAVRDARDDAVEAEQLYRRALRLRDEMLGADSVDAALTRNNLGALLLRVGRVSEACESLAQAEAVLAARLLPGHPHLAAAKRNHLKALVASG